VSMVLHTVKVQSPDNCQQLSSSPGTPVIPCKWSLSIISVNLLDGSCLDNAMCQSLLLSPSVTGALPECHLSHLEDELEFVVPDAMDNFDIEGCHELEMETEDWEDELTPTLMSGSTIRDWGTLHDQIKEDLKKNKMLLLSQVTKLMILSNFATL